MALKYNSSDNSWDKRNFQKHLRSQWFRSKRRLTSFLVVISAVLLFSLLGYFVSGSDAVNNKDTLRLVNILFRHGARNPNHSYKTDPHKDHVWVDGLGALINKGKMQMYETGKKFRKHYSNFIPMEYMENDVLVTSSGYSRTLMSAYTFLAGLYPPTQRQKWHPNLDWQPIPVISSPRTSDKMIAARKPCPKFEELYQKIVAKISAQSQYQDVFDYLTLHTNETMRDILAVELLHGTLLVQKEMGLELPEWTNTVYPGKMLEMSQLSMAAFAYDDDIKKFRGGPLLEDIMGHMEAKIESTLNPDRRLFLYSGHDVTIVNLWRTLSMNELVLPGYGASIAMELHERQPGDFVVETYYWNNTEAEVPLKLNLPLCNNPCTFSSFKNSFSKYVPANWDAECGNTVH